MSLRRPSALGMARKSKSNFFLSFLFLRKDQREAISSVYAFLHAADDAVDRGAGTSPDALALWKRELEACYGGEPATDIGRNLQAAVRRFSLPRDSLVRVLSGIEMDLSRRSYATFAELCGYCDLVAGAVGLVCVRIFSRDDEAGRAYALELGRALQLTNILRDLGEDAASGRVYLPQEDLDRFGVTREGILARNPGGGFQALLDFQVARARDHFRRAQDLARDSGPRTLLAGEIMRVTYESLLDRVEALGPRVLQAKVRLSLPVRAWATARALLGSLSLRPPPSRKGT